jgi:hypothetical protein
LKPAAVALSSRTAPLVVATNSGAACTAAHQAFHANTLCPMHKLQLNIIIIITIIMLPINSS